MILEFGASMIIDRPVYGLLRRRSVAKWSMTMLVPNSNFIIWIYCMDCPKFCFHFKSCTVRQSVLFCFKITFCFFILDANYASTSRWIHGRFPHHPLKPWAGVINTLDYWKTRFFNVQIHPRFYVPL